MLLPPDQDGSVTVRPRPTRTKPEPDRRGMTAQLLAEEIGRAHV